MGFTLFNFMIK